MMKQANAACRGFQVERLVMQHCCRSVMMERLLITLLATAGLAGCGCDKNDVACNAEQASARPTAYVTPSAANAQPDPALARRVTVERVDVVADSLAYGGARGVYVIRDTQTGREFIGVSGVGIAETGDHQAGKTRVRDER